MADLVTPKGFQLKKITHDADPVAIEIMDKIVIGQNDIFIATGAPTSSEMPHATRRTTAFFGGLARSVRSVPARGDVTFGLLTERPGGAFSSDATLVKFIVAIAAVGLGGILVGAMIAGL